MNTLIPLSSLEFKENVSIRFNNILDGLERFKNFEIKADHLESGEKNIIDFLTEVFAENDNEAFVDLYLNNLDESAKDNLLNMCCSDDIDILTKHMELNHTEPYYKITHQSLIPFLVRLNTYEVFFVTFYFTKKPITIWGNYNMTFPCFTNKDEYLDFYENLAKQYKLIH